MEKLKLPNATAVLILGIFSILTCCCWGIVGIIIGITALVLAKKDMALYNENPDLYSNYSNLNTGKILTYIGLVLSTIYLIFNIYIYTVVGMDNFTKIVKEWAENMENQQ